MVHTRPPANDWESEVFPKLVAIGEALDSTLRQIRSTYTGLVSKPESLIAVARKPSEFVRPLSQAIDEAFRKERFVSKTEAWYSDLRSTVREFESELDELKQQVRDADREYFPEGIHSRAQANRTFETTNANAARISAEELTAAHAELQKALARAQGNIQRAHQRFSLVHVQTSEICARFEPLLRAEIAQLWERDRTTTPR